MKYRHLPAGHALFFQARSRQSSKRCGYKVVLAQNQALKTIGLYQLVSKHVTKPAIHLFRREYHDHLATF